MTAASGRTGKWLCLLLALLLPASLGSCDIPRDARGTLARVSDGEPLRAGAASAEPFTSLEGGEAPTGPEAELVRRFAERLGTRVTWTDGAAHELASALEAGALDVVIGGFPEGEHGSLGESRPWTRTRITLGTPEPAPPGDEDVLRNLQVRARRGSAAAALARDRGALVEEVDDLAGAEPPLVGHDWELQSLGLTPASFSLRETPRVLLVRSGENGFLLRLDRFLHEHEAWARARLTEPPPLDAPATP